MRNLIASAFAVILCVGCASYVTPGGPAPLAQLAGANTSDAAQQPSPQFPLRMVAVRLQASDYRSLSATGFGKGQFSVIAPPELLTPTQVQALAQWPGVSRAATFDTALLPDAFDALADLRLAAAKTQADVLLVYTIATTFDVDGHKLQADSKLKLGDKPDADASVTSTASLAFVDVRTGYVYATTQADATVGNLGEAWHSDAALDAKRKTAEQQAFAALLTAARESWSGILSRYQ